MIKFPGTRIGMEAVRYWALAGASLSQPMPEGMGFEWTPQALVITAVELKLTKGRNVLTLPCPTLSRNVMLMAAVAPEMYDAFTSAAIPLHLVDATTLLFRAPILTLTTKDATEYSGPLAMYYLFSDR